MKDQDAKTLIETFHHYVDSFTNGEVFHKGTIIGVLNLLSCLWLYASQLLV